MAFTQNFTQTFNASTTWIVPSIANNGFQPLNNQVNVQCFGAGGNAGTSGLAQGGGGGGGAFAGTNGLAVTPGESVTIQMGSGVTTFWRTNNTVRADFGKNGGNSGGLLGLTGGTAGAAGTAANSVGTNRFSGAAGAAGQILGIGGAGGGGAGDSANGSGTTGGATDGGNATQQPNGGASANNGPRGTGRVLVNYIREFIITRQKQAEKDDLSQRDLDRLGEDTVKTFTDVSTRTLIVRLDNEVRHFNETQALRNIQRKPLQERQYDDLYLRDMIRFHEGSRLLEDNSTRMLIKRIQDTARNMSDQDALRLLVRDFTERTDFNDIFQRALDRVFDESAKFVDVVTRAVERRIQDSKQLFDEDTKRDIIRTLSDENYFSDTYNRLLSRTSEDEHLFDDQAASRLLSRSNEDNRKFVDLFSRELSRIWTDERLFDDTSSRLFTRWAEETGFFDDEDCLRSLSRLQNEFAKFEEVITRNLVREFNKEQYVDDSFRAAQRRADFFGFGLDTELLLRHSHEWSKEHYGPYIQSMLRRIIETIQQSNDFGE